MLAVRIGARAGSRHNGPVPRIAAATVAENREMRREALLSAAATLLARQGAFTVAEVAHEVGLSRSAVYEYYRSAAELIADVIVDELADWSSALQRAVEGAPDQRVHAWIQAVLDYVTDGRHALLRAAGSIELPDHRRAEVQALHHALIAPLVEALRRTGLPDPVREARYVWGVVSVGIERIESGEADADAESAALVSFVDGALSRAAHR